MHWDVSPKGIFFTVMAVVILPLLPDASYGPFRAVFGVSFALD